MGKSSSGSAGRPATPEERQLWATQSENLEMMTKIAEDQYNIGKEDRDYYENIFRDGTDTEAKQALAELKGRITGTEVDPNTIKDVSIDSLLRDTILSATPEFQKAATAVTETTNKLTESYGANVSGLSADFSKGIKDLNTNYQNELQQIKEQTGTINQDVLARETGAAQAGISSAYAEARKQMTADLARRGLNQSGVELGAVANTYQQEALAKAQAGVQARGTALQQSEAIRQQQAALSGSQLQAGVSSLGTAYQGELGAIQNIYGVTAQNAMQNYQTTQAATLQGIAGLTQVAQAGQGIYAGSANYLANAAQTSGSAAQTAGSTMTSMINTRTQAETATQQANAEMFGALVGAGGAIGAKMIPSDARLKQNINYVRTENGHNIYTWEWKEGFDFGYTEGVLAQEVMRYMPEAIVIGNDGYMRVKYDLLGLEYLVRGVA